MLARSKRTNKREFSLRSILGELLSVPLSFFGGLAVGLAAPLIAVAGIVGGVYLFTKKVPFVSQVTTDETTGERRLTLNLMAPREAKAALEARQAELKEAWAKLKSELAEMARQASEGSPPTEEVAFESEP